MHERVEPGLTIRTAVAADLPALRHVYRAASLSNAEDAPALLARPEFLVFTGEGIAGGRTLVAVAGSPGEDRVVGFATVATGQDDGAELDDLFVDPEFRRRGIARHLVRQVVTAARDAGDRRLWVTGNRQALAFYLAVGFVQTGEVSTALGTGLRMSLDLSRPAMTADVRVLLISGSTRSASTNTAALRTALLVAPPGVTAVLFEQLAALPAFNPDADDQTPPDAVRALREQLAASDAVLFCTPEYAGSLPGSFKNLIDWLVGSGELYRKPVAWITVAAAGRGGGASADLAKVLGYVDAAVIEEACVRLPVPRTAVGPDGVVTDADLRAGLVQVLRTVADRAGRASPDPDPKVLS